MAETLREIALMHSKKQPKQIDYLTESSPILESVTYEKSTHGLKHAYEVLDEVVGGSFVDIDAPLPTVDATSNLKWAELSILGGKHKAGQDKVRQFGGMAAYLAKKTPKILRKTGQTAETALIYNILQAYAKDRGKLVSAEDAPSGSKYYSILAVRWQDGEMTGLYDPKGFAPGAIVDVEPIAGGNVYEDPDTKILVYGAYFKSYFGFLPANPNNIAGIVNIDKGEAAPDTLDEQIDEMLASCRAGDGGRTVVYMHRNMLTKLFKFKKEKLQMTTGETNIDRQIASWNGVPIVTSYNFKDGTEDAISL